MLSIPLLLECRYQILVYQCVVALVLLSDCLEIEDLIFTVFVFATHHTIISVDWFKLFGIVSDLVHKL